VFSPILGENALPVPSLIPSKFRELRHGITAKVIDGSKKHFLHPIGGQFSERKGVEVFLVEALAWAPIATGSCVYMFSRCS
jgi:hypothetical protein